jgi:hypothetical protein
VSDKQSDSNGFGGEAVGLAKFHLTHGLARGLGPLETLRRLFGQQGAGFGEELGLVVFEHGDEVNVMDLLMWKCSVR